MTEMKQERKMNKYVVNCGCIQTSPDFIKTIKKILTIELLKEVRAI